MCADQAKIIQVSLLLIHPEAQQGGGGPVLAGKTYCTVGVVPQALSKKACSQDSVQNTVNNPGTVACAASSRSALFQEV